MGHGRRFTTGAALVGWLLALGAVALPWTYNRRSGSRWLLDLLERHPLVVVGYIGGLGILSLALFVLFLQAPPFPALLPATAAALAMTGVAVATPRPDTLWDGVDSTGRSIGGSDPTLLSFGAAAAVLGAVLVLTAAIIQSRTRRVAP